MFILYSKGKREEFTLYRRFGVLIAIFFLTLQNLSAYEVDMESISDESYFIQVGAFKNISNIQEVVDKLSSYDIYLESYKDMHRIQVVNVFATDLKKTLAKIRKIYKKAFIVKRPVLNNNRSKIKSFTKENKPFIPSLNNIEMIQPYSPSLDSNTILKTRKSFL